AGGGGCRRAGAESADLDPGREPYSQVATLLAKGYLFAAKVLVVGELERLVERSVVVAGVVDEPEVVGEWELGREVLAPDLRGVRPDLAREEIHRALGEVGRLGPAGAPIRVRRRLVGQDPDGAGGDVLPLIGAARPQAGDCPETFENA